MPELTQGADDLPFEESGDSLEVVTLEDGAQIPEKEEPAAEPAPEGVVLSAEEYQKLLKGTDATSALTQGLAQLGERLQVPGQQQQPVLPPAFDPNAIEEQAFKQGGFVASVEAVAARMLAQTQGQNAVALQGTNKKLLKYDPETGPLYKRYESEIEKRVQSLPPQFRYAPDIYERVYRDVIFEKQGEIIKEEAGKIAAEQVKAALEAAGIKPGETKTTLPKPAMAQEGASRGAVAGNPKPATKIYLTQSDLSEMEARGMDSKDKEQQKSYYFNVVSKRRK